MDGPDTDRSRAFRLAPLPSSRVTAVVRWVRWVCGLGAGPPLPGRNTRRAPARASRDRGSDLHECDLEAFHHALHVEDEGVLVRVVFNDVVVHVHQDAAGEEKEEQRGHEQSMSSGQVAGEETRQGKKALTILSFPRNQFEESKALISQN